MPNIGSLGDKKGDLKWYNPLVGKKVISWTVGRVKENHRFKKSKFGL